MKKGNEASVKTTVPQHNVRNTNQALITQPIRAQTANQLGSNTYSRFYPTSQKVAFVALEQDETGRHTHWRQYGDLTALSESHRTIQSLNYDTPNRLVRAQSVGGTPLSGIPERSLHYQYEGPEGRSQGMMTPLSPTNRKKWRERPLQVFKQPSSAPRDTQKLGSARVTEEDMNYRNAPETRRVPDQNTVMGQSAINAIRDFTEQYRGQLTPEAERFLTRIKRAEWLHLVAFSLTPRTEEPQQEDNLGAAQARDNTRMMVIEGIAKELITYNNLQVDIRIKFDMLAGSDITKSIGYELIATHGDRRLKVCQDFNVLTVYDSPRASDQLLFSIVKGFLAGDTPLRTGTIALDDEEKAAPVLGDDEESAPNNNTPIGSASSSFSSVIAYTNPCGLFSSAANRPHHNLNQTVEENVTEIDEKRRTRSSSLLTNNCEGTMNSQQKRRKF